MPRTVIIREPVYALTIKAPSELQLKLSGPQGPAGGVGSGGSGNAILSDTPPATPTNGLFWYDTEDGILAVWDGAVWVGQEFLPITVAPEILTFGGETLTFEGEPLTFTS